MCLIWDKHRKFLSQWMCCMYYQHVLPTKCVVQCTVFGWINAPGADAKKTDPKTCLICTTLTFTPQYHSLIPWKFHWDTLIFGWVMAAKSQGRIYSGRHVYSAKYGIPRNKSSVSIAYQWRVSFRFVEYTLVSFASVRLCESLAVFLLHSVLGKLAWLKLSKTSELFIHDAW